MSLAQRRIIAPGLQVGQVTSAIVALAFLALPGCKSNPTVSTEIIDPLMAPIQQAPPQGRGYGYRPASAPPLIVFEWRHGVPTKQIPSPHQAERIIICVYDEKRGDCESGTRDGVPKPIWFEAAADDPAVNRTPIELEKNPFVPSPDFHLGYEFRTSLRMRPEYRDRSLLWQIGACSGGTCRMSDPRSLRLGRPVDAVGL